jgi:betaine-homocysteine S-methyltransferase
MCFSLLHTGKSVYITDLDSVRCNRTDFREFAEEAKAAGVQYIGVCCGNVGSLTREVAEVYGRRPPGSKYAADPTESMFFGDAAKAYNRMDKVAAWALTGKPKV